MSYFHILILFGIMAAADKLTDEELLAILTKRGFHVSEKPVTGAAKGVGAPPTSVDPGVSGPPPPSLAPTHPTSAPLGPTLAPLKTVSDVSTLKLDLSKYLPSRATGDTGTRPKVDFVTSTPAPGMPIIPPYSLAPPTSATAPVSLPPPTPIPTSFSYTPLTSAPPTTFGPAEMSRITSTSHLQYNLTASVHKIPSFSGDDQKGDVSFVELRFEIRCLMSDPDISPGVQVQAIRQSLRGTARKVLVSLGEGATATEILRKLDSLFGDVSTNEMLMQEFFNSFQKPEESVTSFGCRLEGLLQLAVDHGHIAASAKNDMLQHKFWTYLSSERLKSQTRHKYDSITEYDSLLREIRKVEKEMAMAPTPAGKKSATQQPVVVNDQLKEVEDRMDKKLSDLEKRLDDKLDSKFDLILQKLDQRPSGNFSQNSNRPSNNNNRRYNNNNRFNNNNNNRSYRGGRPNNFRGRGGRPQNQNSTQSKDNPLNG